MGLNKPAHAKKQAPLSASAQALVEVEALHQKWFGQSYDLDVVRVALASAAAAELAGDPLWVLLVGSPGSCKTETVNGIATAGALVISTITSEGALLSGTKSTDKKSPGTGGLLRQVGNKGFIVIKDVTSILSMQYAARQQVLAALREIYDGKWVRTMGNEGGKTLVWAGHLGVLGAVTDAWDTHHEATASMGDRFVLLRVQSRDHRRSITRQAMGNSGSEDKMRHEIGLAVGRLLRGVPRVRLSNCLKKNMIHLSRLRILPLRLERRFGEIGWATSKGRMNPRCPQGLPSSW